MAQLVKLTCRICGNTFYGRPNRKYCSDECLKEGKRLNSQQWTADFKKRDLEGYKKYSRTKAANRYKKMAKDPEWLKEYNRKQLERYYKNRGEKARACD